MLVVTFVTVAGHLEDPDPVPVLGQQQIVVHLREVQRGSRLGIEPDRSRL